jgi:hypothetical protein
LSADLNQVETGVAHGQTDILDETDGEWSVANGNGDYYLQIFSDGYDSLGVGYHFTTLVPRSQTFEIHTAQPEKLVAWMFSVGLLLGTLLIWIKRVQGIPDKFDGRE